MPLIVMVSLAAFTVRAREELLRNLIPSKDTGICISDFLGSLEVEFCACNPHELLSKKEDLSAFISKEMLFELVWSGLNMQAHVFIF